MAEVGGKDRQAVLRTDSFPVPSKDSVPDHRASVIPGGVTGNSRTALVIRSLRTQN